MTSPSAEGTPSAEQDVGEVLRNAGRRSEPPEEVLRSVRASVESQWREVVSRRTRRRRIGLSLAAAIVLAAVGLWSARPWLVGPGQRMADVQIALGSVQARAGWLGSWQPVGPRSALRVGEELATAADGRVALGLADGVSVRLDHDTRIRLLDAGRISVDHGALYVDSGSPAPAARASLLIVTPAGEVRHLGTQYEARIVGSEVQIAVREGKVELDTSTGAAHRAVAGEQMTITSAGSVVRSAVSTYDGRWQWVSAAAPPFNIDGRPVADFLTWAARELGRDLVYADAPTEAEAARVRLNGSIAGLSPEEALAAVLPTTPLRTEMSSGHLVVSLTSLIQ